MHATEHRDAPAGGFSARAHEWFSAELDRLETRHPRTRALLRTLWSRPQAVLLGLAALLGILCGALSTETDQVRFTEAGLGMLGSAFFDVLSDPWLQIGPVYLLGLGLASGALQLVGLPAIAAGVVVASAQMVGVTWLALWITRRAATLRGADARLAQWGVGGALLLGGYLADAVLMGHPEELGVGLLVAAAALGAGTRRPVAAGVLVALAVGVKQWGPIGAGVLAVRGQFRRTVLAVATFVFVVAVEYVPFAVFGQMRTFEWHWGFASDSLLLHLTGGLGAADWTVRMIQGAAAGLAGLLLALRRRGSTLVAVIALLDVRILLDPMRLTYYWTPLVAVLLIWLWTSSAAPVRRARVAVTVLLPLLVLTPYLVPTTVFWRAGDVLTILLPFVCLYFDREDRPLVAGTTASAQTPADDHVLVGAGPRVHA